VNLNRMLANTGNDDFIAATDESGHRGAVRLNRDGFSPCGPYDDLLQHRSNRTACRLLAMRPRGWLMRRHCVSIPLQYDDVKRGDANDASRRDHRLGQLPYSSKVSRAGLRREGVTTWH
jgi:hypothetical protein